MTKLKYKLPHLQKTDQQAYQEFQSNIINSSLQQAIVTCAKELSPTTLQRSDKDIIAILPFQLPKEDPSSLIVFQSKIKLILNSAKESIQQLLFLQLGIRSYSNYCQTFSQIFEKNYYKIPCATANFTLFPIESVDKGIWLNISKIKDISHDKTTNQLNFLMTDGLVIPTYSCRRSIAKQLELAYRCGAIIRYEYQANYVDIEKLSLTELLNIPVNKFNKKIIERLDSTNQWPSHWLFSHAYYKIECQKSQSILIENQS